LSRVDARDIPQQQQNGWLSRRVSTRKSSVEYVP
jgi:hypothetical protein